MTKADEIQKLLDGWMKEYNVPGECVFGGYEHLSTSKKVVLGNCRYVSRYKCVVHLGSRFEKRPLGMCETAIAFHEFSHANAFLEDGKSDGHNAHWREYRKRRKDLWMWDIIAKFVYVFL